ncbi:MAG: hypothetical protein ACYC4Q_08325, partial [Victivallaceae bacterium]
MRYRGYNIDDEGLTLVWPWLVWPSAEFHVKWSDVTRVVTCMFCKHYLTVIKYEKDGAMYQIKLLAGRKNVLWGRLIPVKYYELIKYMCLM